MHHLARYWMYEAQCLCMQRLTWTKLETVAHELAVFTEVGTFEYLVTPIHVIIEKDMTDMFHVYPYLMRTPRLKVTFYKRHVAESLEHPVMGNRMFSDRIIG